MRMNFFSGTFLIIFVLATGAITLFSMPGAISKTGNPSLSGIVHGTWAVKFEKSLGETLPVYDPSRSFWGRLEYALFRQGRKGVVVGTDGWLFTDEEFSCPPHYKRNVTDNLAYVTMVRDRLKAKGIELSIVLIPAKARVYGEKLGENVIPSCRGTLYGDALAALTGTAIPTADILSAIEAQGQKEALYLKTDTHWAPSGAALAAQTVARTVENISVQHGDFTTQPGESRPHDGDLTRYIPGVGAPVIVPDQISVFTNESAPVAGEGLFGDNAPEITLVGTSYSANPLWNFEGFLKAALHADILNMADEGLGPFAVMETYLKNDALKKTPPRLIIWEIPERYIMVPRQQEVTK